MLPPRIPENAHTGTTAPAAAPAATAAVTDGLDAAGECGEYHTFGYDGPAFA